MNPPQDCPQEAAMDFARPVPQWGLAVKCDLALNMFFDLPILSVDVYLDCRSAGDRDAVLAGN